MTLHRFRSVRINDGMPKITFLHVQIWIFLNNRYFGRPKFYFYSLDVREKLKFWGAIVGTRTQIYILGLGPYLMMWICPRRSKWLERLHNGGSCKERWRDKVWRGYPSWILRIWVKYVPGRLRWPFRNFQR